MDLNRHNFFLYSEDDPSLDRTPLKICVGGSYDRRHVGVVQPLGDVMADEGLDFFVLAVADELVEVI